MNRTYEIRIYIPDTGEIKTYSTGTLSKRSEHEKLGREIFKCIDGIPDSMLRDKIGDTPEVSVSFGVTAVT